VRAGVDRYEIGGTTGCEWAGGDARRRLQTRDLGRAAGIDRRQPGPGTVVRTGEIGNSRSGTWVTVSGLIGLPCAILKRDCSAEATFPLWLASSAPARQEGFPTAMHNFELGTAPGFSLLPPCRLQHLVDR